MILISNFLLWIFVVLLLVAVIALTRQIQMLRERLMPVEAIMSTGTLRIGAPSPVLSVHTLDGRVVTLGGRDDIEQSVLMLFVSAGCAICDHLIPSAMMLARAQSLRLVFIANGDSQACRDLVRTHRMLAYDVIKSAQTRLAYRVSEDPFAVLLDGDGGVAAMGFAGTREQLQTLLAAQVPNLAAAQENRGTAKPQSKPAFAG